MSSLHEISCKHCGSSISLGEEWDRTSRDFRPQDRVLSRCLMCGGEMQLFKRWIDPPPTHPECTHGRWSDTPCTMCWGPMTIGSEVDLERKIHQRCRPEFWYEKTCDLCLEPIRIHVDWEDPPSRHRGCETEEWYEKGCKYCGTTLKVHINWQDPPSAHKECQPKLRAEHVQTNSDLGMSAETNGGIPQGPEFSEVAQTAYATPTHPESANGNGWYTNGHYAPKNQITDTASPDGESLTPSPNPDLEPIFEQTIVETFESADLHQPIDNFDDTDLHGEGDPITKVIDEASRENDYMAELFDTADESIEEEHIACENFEDARVEIDEPTVPDFLLAQDNGAEIDLGESDVEEESEANLSDIADGSASHENFCTRCGKQLIRLGVFQFSKDCAQNETDEICRECGYDKMLICGAVAALAKEKPFELNVSSELRTITQPVTLVTNSETGELIAEVILLDNGIFAPERVAIVSDPFTGERLSKTVFGNKGLFSSLRTAETYDREGKLLNHARHGGGELALAEGAEPSDESPVQVGRNRFFFKKRSR